VRERDEITEKTQDGSKEILWGEIALHVVGKDIVKTLNSKYAQGSRSKGIPMCLGVAQGADSGHHDVKDNREQELLHEQKKVKPLLMGGMNSFKEGRQTKSGVEVRFNQRNRLGRGKVRGEREGWGLESKIKVGKKLLVCSIGGSSSEKRQASRGGGEDRWMQIAFTCLLAKRQSKGRLTPLGLNRKGLVSQEFQGGCCAGRAPGGRRVKKNAFQRRSSPLGGENRVTDLYRCLD